MAREENLIAMSAKKRKGKKEKDFYHRDNREIKERKRS